LLKGSHRAVRSNDEQLLKASRRAVRIVGEQLLKGSHRAVRSNDEQLLAPDHLNKKFCLFCPLGANYQTGSQGI
jgi:hypothetical protein